MGALRPRKSRLFAAFALAIGLAAAPLSSRADDPEAVRRGKVVLKVDGRGVTVGELEDRLAGIPPFQLVTFGATRDEVVKAYVDQILVRDLVLAAGADKQGLAKEVPTKHQLDRALSNATLRKARAAYPSASAIPMEDVKRYYEDNKSRFDSPERINVWRILVKTRGEADAVIQAAKSDSSITKFNDLAREKSIDKATNMRGGNLGFLGPDGTSNEAGLKVDPEIVKAALTVKDGELVQTPVPEGASFAVVWRRATVPANKRTLDESTAQIRATLFRERTEHGEKALIDGLRAKNLKERNEGLLGIIELRAFDAGISLPRLAASSSASPAPKK